ncbi:hypothetical protein K501DRAFT_333576 [Backusella circina FSU 941]|nr:hypothetical protein K501DRAFT_333576 [Backusella circina FSU 941]
MSTTIIDDSFSRDLLRLFDKKRSRIHYELGLTEIEPSPESSLVSITPSVHEQVSHIHIVERKTHRRRAASDLLRRSSAYLKAKLNHFKHRSQDHLHQAPDPCLNVATLKEYPPKPLVYAPVEPVEEPVELDERDLLHKISVPLFQHCHPFRERRLSLPNIRRKISKRKQ